MSVRILASYGSQVIRKEMQMKRPVTMMIVASLLASATALAAGNPNAARAAAERNDRGHENRGSDNRGNDNRGNDNRGHDNRGHDDRRNDDRGNTQSNSRNDTV